MTHDVSALRNATWRKSSRSNQEGQCVEIAVTAQVIGVRDSKNIDGKSVLVSPRVWAAFVARIKREDRR